jgi:hypothetical protein
MEQQVLKILEKPTKATGWNEFGYMTYSGNLEKAKEITSMVFEFIEWIRKNCEVSIDAKKWWLFDHKIEIIGEFTDKELFKYWWDNVKNK